MAIEFAEYGAMRRSYPLGLKAAAFALAALFSTYLPAHASPPSPVVISVQGMERRALVAIPEGGGTPAPVVFAFHGHGGTALRASQAYRCEELWPEAIVVYPQGLPTPGGIVDPRGRKPGWQLNIGDLGDRDLAFFDELLRFIKGRAAIDESRVYVVGHSNGAVFAYLLWAARGDAIAAIGPIAGIIPTKLDRSTLGPMPVFHVAGRNDPVVKFPWQAETIEFVKRVNGCGEIPATVDGFVSAYGSTGGKPVVTYIDDGGHGVPEGAMGRIIEFFKGLGEPVGR